MRNPGPMLCAMFNPGIGTRNGTGIDLLKGMAAVAYIAHDRSRLRLRITSRGADWIFLPYSAIILFWKKPFGPLFNPSSVGSGW